MGKVEAGRGGEDAAAMAVPPSQLAARVQNEPGCG